MTTYDKTQLKTFFQNGDIPTGTNYSDLIDSQINLAESTEQSMIAALKTTELITPRVSASTVACTNGNIANANIGVVSATTVYASSGLFQTVGIISAAGSAQATAAVLTDIINHGKGIVDGQTTGFMPLANKTGLVQYLFNEGASANLWPPVGGKINGLAVNTPYSIAASASITIFHIAASAYGVVG